LKELAAVFALERQNALMHKRYLEQSTWWSLSSLQTRRTSSGHFFLCFLYLSLN